MILEIIITVFSLGIVNKFIYDIIKSEKDNVEKIFEIVLLGVLDIFIVVYYIDRFNLPSLLSMNTGVDTQNWLIIITTCISSIVSASVGGLIAFGIARRQIKQNEEQAKENNRIQNMPLLKYEIRPSGRYNEEFLENFIDGNTVSKNTSVYGITFKAWNIGQNSVKQLFVDFNSSFIPNKERIVSDNTQNSIEKGGYYGTYAFFRLEKGESYPIELIVYYEDVLQNWYKQIVSINCETEPKEHLPKLSISFTVGEEKMIDSEEVKQQNNEEGL